MSVLTTEAIVTLARLIDEVDFDGAQLCHVEMGELADGSQRPFALVTTIEAAGLEQTYRFCLPAVDGAPRWASRATTAEIRVAERWRIIPFADGVDRVGVVDRVGKFVTIGPVGV